MSITLISAVPGGGKSSYVVWHEIKPAVDKGRIVYIAGIPKLKLPTILTTYAALSHWHERTQKNPEVIDEADAIYELNNVSEGSLIVIDEAWKLWPAAGRAKPSEDIEYLRMHRHHGLDFILVAQSPSLIHSDVLALVEKHIHITPTWSGRKIYEWPEYCSTPRLKTSKSDAVKRQYKLPKQAFDLYESASIHTKPTKTIPTALWGSLFIFLVLPILIYVSYTRILQKIEPVKDEQQVVSDQQTVTAKPVSVVSHNPSSSPAPAAPPAPVPVVYPVVSNQVDWSKVMACISNKVQCKCYGYSSELLVIPPDTCRLAVTHGWPGKQPSTSATTL